MQAGVGRLSAGRPCCNAPQVAALSPGREYQVRVRAGNACGFGPWTDPAIVITQPDVPGACCRGGKACLLLRHVRLWGGSEQDSS